MATIQDLPTYGLLIVLSGMFLGAGILSMTAFYNSVAPLATQNATYAAMALTNATIGTSNIGSQLGTVGTIVGVALIIGVIIAAFGGALRGRAQE